MSVTGYYNSIYFNNVFRLPSADLLLSQGQSTTWLLGHKLITVTTSGCSQSALRNGLCDRCWTVCKGNENTDTERSHSPDHLETSKRF